MGQSKDPGELLGNAISFGKVASVDRVAATCRLTIGDFETPDIPWFAGRAGHTIIWSAPSIGEQAMLIAPEGDMAAGVALLGLYSNSFPPPDDSEKRDLIKFDDGAIISYDADTHRLLATLPVGGTAEISADGGITINGPVTINGDLTLDGDAGVSGTVTADADVVGGGKHLASHTHGGVRSGSDSSGGPL
jgi:phage baseplate assembly protein V